MAEPRDNAGDGADLRAAGAVSRWRIAVDTGGTFTDCLAIAPDGSRRRAKVLSSGVLRAAVVPLEDGPVGPRTGEQVVGALPAVTARLRLVSAQPWPPGFLDGYEATIGGRTTVVRHHDDSEVHLRDALPIMPGETAEFTAHEESPVVGIRLLTSTPLSRALPGVDLLLATTRGTNALLERRVAATALLVTRGFGDLLRIGDQRRPDLFARVARREWPLHDVVIEVDERLDAAGNVLVPLSEEGCAEVIELLRASGAECVAIALLHAWRRPVHEEQLADACRRAGYRHVSVSSALSPTIGIVSRATTVVVDACLSPVIAAHLEGVAVSASGDARDRRGPGGPGASSDPDTAGSFRVMTSAGGVVAASRFAARDSLLSGPAGGVVGAMDAGRRSGFERVIGFDMGGTSTDVSRIDNGLAYVFTHRVGAVTIAAPAVDIETVAAGGGSICRFDGDRLAVGPQSAGAEPGPACYGRGGPLTITDVNLLLGRLDPHHFEIPIDPGAARAAAARALPASSTSVESMLEGFLAVADEAMADAIATVSLRRGHDPAAHALLAFGGAGGLHACGVADRLRIDTIILPEEAGVLSAAGLLAAEPERFAERQLLENLTDGHAPRLAASIADAAADAVTALADDGVPRCEIIVRQRLLRMRLAGQESCLLLEVDAAPDVPALRRCFRERYLAMYGHQPPERPIELESLRVVASRPRHTVVAVAPTAEERDAACASWRRASVNGALVDVPVYHADAVAAGEALTGPAALTGRHHAAWVAPGWRGVRDSAGALLLRRDPGPIAGRRDGAGAGADLALAEAARLSIFAGRIESVATAMGELLRRTALSVNVKERLDFSCGVLDPDGALVANAPHVPVHLGALGMCVRRVASVMTLGPGDVAVTNHPAFGGSHLPDVTVIAPAFDDAGVLIGYAASRAHHAEIGGTRPGSMPPDATCLADEGVVLPPEKVVEHEILRLDRVQARLSHGPWPSRAVADNLADLEAAIAACHHGVAGLRELASTIGTAVLRGQMRALEERAATLGSTAIAALDPGVRTVHDHLDDGTPLTVSVERVRDTLVIDLTGSGAVHRGNFNATPAIVRAAVMYVMRLLVDQPIPLNEGLLRPVQLHLPMGFLSPVFDEDPRRCPAVGAGNTETSQRLVEVLVRALGLSASSQGTMNNLLFGDDTFGYYETICGGAGAGPGAAGGSAIHTHMTNTRITDPEVLEHRLPVRLERFAIRRGSGGAGRWTGGDGVVRSMRFLQPVSVSLVTGHRRSGPPGFAGGGAGAPGAQRVQRADGTLEALDAVAAFDAGATDLIEIETPGGGGWGAAHAVEHAPSLTRSNEPPPVP